MSYIEYRDGKYHPVKGVRPTNQSQWPVLEKIANRLNNLVNEDEGWTLTALQEKFVDEIGNGSIQLAENEIDIAHNISIKAIIFMVADKMNDPETIKFKDIKVVADAFISTEEEDANKMVRAFFNTLKDKATPDEEKIELANEVIERLNKAHKNLIPGHKSPNRSLGSHQDPHLLEKDGKLCVPAYSQKINSAFAKVDHTGYGPKEKDIDGERSYQTSSVHKDKNKAYIPADKLDLKGEKSENKKVKNKK